MVADIMGGNSTDGTSATARPEIVVMRAAMAKLRRRVADLEAFDPHRVEKREDPSVETLSKAIDSTLLEVFGADTPEYQRYCGAKVIDTAPFLLNGTPISLVRSGLEQGKTTAIALLDQAIAAFEEAIAEGKALTAAPAAQPAAAPPTPVAAAPEPTPSIMRKAPDPAAAAASAPAPATPATPRTPGAERRDVLVVCGHDTVVSGEIARFLRKAELDAILMHEQGAEALTDVERLERHSGVGFAVVLLPPEEETAAPANGAHRPRGRAALVAELYYFAGKLGRGRVCALTTSETAAPPVSGVSYAIYDPYEGWQKWLLKALEEAGYHIDWGKALR